MFDFRFNIQILSLNQGQGSVFKVRKCAQSIPRIKLPLKGHLLKNVLPGPLNLLGAAYTWGAAYTREFRVIAASVRKT